MRRRTKIVATLGPATSSEEMIAELIVAGMNVARINMSHGSYDGHRQVIHNVRAASQRVGREVSILLDLQGPKIRVDKLAEPLLLEKDQLWAIGIKEKKSAAGALQQRYIPTVYRNLTRDAGIGAQILFDDGLMEAVVVDKTDDVLTVKIIEGGLLKSNKGINLPNVKISARTMTEKDQEDLYFGLSENVDYVALSFVRTAEEIRHVKILLHKMRVNVPIVAKIERPEAILNIESIIEVTDVIMIARGDMGVEIGNHAVPTVQKDIIHLCNKAGKPVITATQMLESMAGNTRPTRAEASDVANAIWDGTDAVMLSAETASGKYPVVTIKMMDRIIVEAEKRPKERPHIKAINLASVSSATQIAASLVAEKINAKWIIVATDTGNSCLQLSRFRPRVPCLGVTHSLKVARKLCLLWGITPYIVEDFFKDSHDYQDELIALVRQNTKLVNGDKLVFSQGEGVGEGRSNSIKVKIIKDRPKVIAGRDVTQSVVFERGSIHLDTAQCGSCQNCVTICPHDIWQVTDDDSKITYIHEQNARNCAFDMECVQLCPTGAIEIHENNSTDVVNTGREVIDFKD